MRREYASGRWSLTKASTSPGKGGRPVRSRDIRRIRRRRSVGGLGFSPFASNFARMKLSIRVRGHRVLRHTDGETRFIGWKAHHFLPSSISIIRVLALVVV